MSIAEVERKLALARQNQAHFEALARHPKLSPRAALAAHNLARSHRAAAALYQKALDYERQKAQEVSPHDRLREPELDAARISRIRDRLARIRDRRGAGATKTAKDPSVKRPSPRGAPQ
jgi:uncharacterized membrane protein YccC